MSTLPHKSKPVDQSYLRKAAFAYLQRYASSTSNLKRVLMRKVRRRTQGAEFDLEQVGQDIDAVVGWCLDNKLLDDEQFAETRLVGLQRKGSSERKIRASLQEKGVDAELVEKVLRNSDHDDVNAARRYAQRKRLGPFRSGKREENTKRDLAALARAGFGFSAAKAALADHRTDWEE
ncbi:MAG: regulatory protein RecX [Stappiaceae bacterium]